MFNARVRWNPSYHPSGIQAYEVSLLINGASMSTGTQVQQAMFEIPSINGDTQVSLSVVAISNTGRRSSPGTFSFQTPSETPVSPPPPADVDPTSPDGFTVEYF
jgi:hypothetical protein